ncbi:hypothetical protein N9Y88_05810, partial [Candidatus Pelagibacter bacterium]|nr:hypothetical protein [Candidatus Pelagibacter bacterium]
DRRLNSILIPFLVKYEMVNLLCWLLIFSLKKINKISPKGKSRYKVIVLNKGGGTDDLIQSQIKYNKSIIYLQSYRSFFKSIYYSIFNIKNKNNVGAYPKESKILKEKYLIFLIKFLTVLKNKHNINAFIGFSFAYFAEKDLQRACSQIKLPFLLLLKESVVTEFEKKYYIYSLKKTNEKFNGYKIAVYSNLAKKFLTESKYVNKNKVKIVGCSRLEESFSFKNKSPKNQIIYYAIQNDRGLPHKFIKTFGNKFFKDFKHHHYYNSKYNWNDLHKKTLRVLKKFAINNQETNIIIKKKIGVDYDHKDYLNLPKNINVIFDGVGHQLLENSKVIIAWNTTAIMEGIAANRFILLPYYHFNKNNFRKENELILNLKNKNYGYSEQDFYEKLDYFIKKRYNKNINYNNRFSLKYYLGNADNKASLRLDSFIKKNIMNY